MNTIGFSSGAVGRNGNVDRMVQAVLHGSGHSSEFVKLSDMNYSGCKGCVHLCSRPQVCKLEDDLLPYYQKIKDADAVVIGAPVYFRSVNSLMMSFLERFFGYRHVSIPIAGKPFVVVISGSRKLDQASNQMIEMLTHFDVNVLKVVHFKSGVPPCLKCGRHRECEIGGLYKMMGDDALALKIRKEHFHKWEDSIEASGAVQEAAAVLKNL